MRLLACDLMASSSAVFRRHIALCALLTLAATVAPRTQPSPDHVTLAWDRNRGRDTVGYYVHVGTEPGEYTERYDAGTATAFTFSGGVRGQRYYFAVAAYNAARRESALSNEVSTVIGGEDRPVGPVEGFADASARHESTTQARAESLGPISGLSPMPDGGAVLVESARHVRLIDRDGLRSQPLLSLEEPDTALTEVVVAPAFEQTAVFVGMTSLQRDGTRGFRVVRYRLAGDTLGEGATIVGGLSFRGEHAPRFDVDDTGHILIAMPGGDGARVDPYAAHLLRFAPDGTVPDGQPGFSPVLASGPPIPTDVDAAGDHVWIVGVDRRGQSSVASAPLASDRREWPGRIINAEFAERRGLAVAAFDVSGTAGSAQHAVMIDTEGYLYRVTSLAAAAADVQRIPWAGDTPVDIALAPDGTAHLVVKSVADRYSVFALQPEP